MVRFFYSCSYMRLTSSYLTDTVTDKTTNKLLFRSPVPALRDPWCDQLRFR